MLLERLADRRRMLFCCTCVLQLSPFRTIGRLGLAVDCGPAAAAARLVFVLVRLFEAGMVFSWPSAESTAVVVGHSRLGVALSVCLALWPLTVACSCTLAFSACVPFRLGVEVETKLATTRAGCSSAAVPTAGLARGTDCPVYLQGVVMKPGCHCSTGILLHNKLEGSRPASYTLIW